MPLTVLCSYPRKHREIKRLSTLHGKQVNKININNRKSRIGYPTISAITMQLYSAYTPFSTKNMNELMTKI